MSQLEKEGIVDVDDYGSLQMSFDILGTTSRIILSHVKDEMIAYSELVQKMPEHLRVGQRLKNTLVFLLNFQKLQEFKDPSSGITYLAREGDQQIEVEIDDVFDWGLNLEPQYRYIMDPEDHESLD